VIPEGETIKRFLGRIRNDVVRKERGRRKGERETVNERGGQ